VLTGCTPDVAAALREQFRPLAQRYRRRSWMTLVGMVGAIVCTALGMVLLPNLGLYFWLGGVCSCLLIMLTGPVTPPCPACHHQLDSRFGAFCPECGSQSLRPGGWLGYPRCDSCGKTMHCGRGRQYKIRACSFCGLWLDQKGF